MHLGFHGLRVWSLPHLSRFAWDQGSGKPKFSATTGVWPLLPQTMQKKIMFSRILIGLQKKWDVNSFIFLGVVCFWTGLDEMLYSSLRMLHRSCKGPWNNYRHLCALTMMKKWGAIFSWKHQCNELCDIILVQTCFMNHCPNVWSIPIPLKRW